LDKAKPIIDDVRIEQIGAKFFAVATYNGMAIKEALPKDVVKRWPELERNHYLHGVARRIKKKIEHIKRINHA
jgi:hypothetical protein